MKLDRIHIALIAVLALTALIQLAALLASPAVAFDAKVGSDSAAVSVSTSADGNHVYVCDGQRCYASHDAGATFVRLKVD